MLNVLLITLFLGDAGQGITIHAPDALRTRLEPALSGMHAPEDIRVDIRLYGSVRAPETMRLNQNGQLVIGSGEVIMKCLIEITRQQRLIEAILVSAKGPDEAAAVDILGGQIRTRLSPWLRRGGH